MQGLLVGNMEPLRTLLLLLVSLALASSHPFKSEEDFDRIGKILDVFNMHDVRWLCDFRPDKLTRQSQE